MVHNESNSYRPIRTVVITFVVLMIFVGAFMPFVEEIRQVWLLALVYCAVLSFTVVGIVRLRERIVSFFLMPLAIIALPIMVGLTVMQQNRTLLEHLESLHVSLYAFYALAIWTFGLAVAGWVRYFNDSRNGKFCSSPDEQTSH